MILAKPPGIPCVTRRNRCAAFRCLLTGMFAFAALSSTAQPFDLQGHRGARGLAPENTLVAFAKALGIGVTTLELDVAMTKDGVLVVSHNTKLNPDISRLNGAFLRADGPVIRTLTLADVKSYDVGRLKPETVYAQSFAQQTAVDGTAIPTLAEVFDLAKATTVRFNIETKITPASGDETPDPETFVRAIIETATTAGVLDRILIQSFDWRTLRVAQTLAPAIPRACLTSETFRFDTIQRWRRGASPWTGLDASRFGGSTPQVLKAAGCDLWSPNFANVTAESIREAKEAGLLVVPWTVNEPTDAERLIGWGVDGLITDYPDRVRAVLAAMGIAPPAPQTIPAQ
jgi:glycerophosphoryl diester phosphodiesterase